MLLEIESSRNTNQDGAAWLSEKRIIPGDTLRINGTASVAGVTLNDDGELIIKLRLAGVTISADNTASL